LVIGLSIALGASIAAANPNAAPGADAAATGPIPSTSWCITQRDGNRSCYESLFTCIIAGIAHEGSCTQQPDLDAPDANEVRQRPPPAPRRTPVPTHNHSLSAAQQEQLFRDFVKWTGRSTGNSH